MNDTFMYDPSEFQAIAFTMKMYKNKYLASRLDYLNIISDWYDKKLIVSCSALEVELDSKGKLHAHGVIIIKKHLLKRKLKVENCYIYLTDMYNIDRWTEYITKGDKCKIDNTKYMF